LWFFLSQNRVFGVSEPGIVWPVTEPIITINILSWIEHLACSYGKSYIPIKQLSHPYIMAPRKKRVNKHRRLVETVTDTLNLVQSLKEKIDYNV